MDVAPPQTDAPGRRSFRRNPLVAVLGVIVIWLVLAIASEELWRHAFGYSTEDAIVLSVALFAYLALFIGVMVLIAWTLGRER